MSKVKQVSEIVDSLNKDMEHHKTILSKYKKWHFIMAKSQILLNSLSIAGGSSAAITLGSGLGTIAGIILSTLTASTAGSAVLCGIIDEKILSHIHKHYQLLILARTLNLRLFQKYLYDEKISEQDFLNILDMMTSYYKQKDLIESKSLFVNNDISELAKNFKTALNGGSGVLNP